MPPVALARHERPHPQGKTKTSKASHYICKNRQDKARKDPDKTRQDKTRRNKTRRDKTRLDKARLD